MVNTAMMDLPGTVVIPAFKYNLLFILNTSFMTHYVRWTGFYGTLMINSTNKAACIHLIIAALPVATP